MDLPNASSRLSTQPHHMPWNGRDVSKFSFPTPVTWIHYTDDIMLTCEDLPLAENLTGFAGPPTTERMGSESTENSRSKHGSKVLGSCMVG